ncbi:MAG: tRNA uridine-5-carboxymethylaminomethyl(34) synthesis GTPase MnmE [Hyphomicrobium sp.]
MSSPSTIFALSSAPGRSAVAVIRVSGPAVPDVLARMVHPVPQPRVAALRVIRHPNSGAALDQALVLYFAGPRSETGEDLAEFQVHGGPAVVQAVLAALGAIPGCRHAEPGEFVRRAFLNGKLDLAEVEGLADLIDAETDGQRRQALAQAGGALSRLYEGWRSELIAVSALLEAAIDFSDEGDVGSGAFDQAQRRARALAGALDLHLNDGHRGEILREGFRVALLGAPNAGKSSLLNALARRDVAIVSPEPGTTRDVIEVRLDLGGVPVILSDTAGLRTAEGAIEREGIRRSLAVSDQAHLVLWLYEPGAPNSPGHGLDLGLDSGRIESFSRETLLRIATKADLRAQTSDTASRSGQPSPVPDAEAPFLVSAHTGAGLDALIAAIAERARLRVASDRPDPDPAGSIAPVITRQRHRDLIQACRAALLDLIGHDATTAELAAEDARRSAHALGRVTGRVDVEDVLGEIFGRFCIGK